MYKDKDDKMGVSQAQGLQHGLQTRRHTRFIYPSNIPETLRSSSFLFLA